MRKTVIGLLLCLPIITMAQLTTFKAQTTQWGHTANAALYTPDSAAAGETFPVILYFHDAADRGTSVANLLNSPLFKRITSGWKPADLHPILSNTIPPIKFIVFALQGEFWAPEPGVMQYAFDYVKAKYKLPVDTNRIYALGVGIGGPAAATFAKLDSTGKKILGAPPVAVTTSQVNGATFRSWNDMPLPVYSWLLTQGKHGIVMPPIPPPAAEDMKICVGQAGKVKKIIVLLKDGTWQEFDSTHISTPQITITIP